MQSWTRRHKNGFLITVILSFWKREGERDFENVTDRNWNVSLAFLSFPGFKKGPKPSKKVEYVQERLRSFELGRGNRFERIVVTVRSGFKDFRERKNHCR